MIHVTKRSGRATIAAAIAGLVAGAALLSASPPPAAAAHYSCPEAEFCLYFNDDANGGYYHFEGSDSNLNNDKYEGGDTGEIVGNTSRSIQNNGQPGSKDDVVVYNLPGYKGADACISMGLGGTLGRDWWNKIESYRWVTDEGCERAGIITLAEQ